MLNDFNCSCPVYIACGYTDLRRGIDGLKEQVPDGSLSAGAVSVLRKTAFYCCISVGERQFGTSSEGLMDQLSLKANEVEVYAYGTKNATAGQMVVKVHTCKRQSDNVLDIVPEGTPTEVVKHRLSEGERTCDICGAVMEEIGKEVRWSLKMEPARFWIQEDVYYTYACKQCEAETGEGNLRKTSKQPTLCPGSFASPEAVAHIITQKFVMYSLLYRLEQEFQRRMLKEPCRTSTSKSYMWVYQTSG